MRIGRRGAGNSENKTAKIRGERMEFDREKYREKVRAREARSPILKNCFFAFVIGGAICLFGEGLLSLYRAAGLPEREAGTLVTVTLIFLAATLTGIGWFDSVARIAGAGTLVPVTGFANAVVAPALDTKNEGLILGVGAKIFVIAGPVLLYATLSGALYGVILYVVRLFI